MNYKPVQSLQRGLAIIEAISLRRQGASLKELAAAADCSQAATFHLVQTLVAAGYVNRLEQPVRYTLGDKLQTLIANQQQDRFYDTLLKEMASLYQQLPGAAVYLAEYVGSSVAVRHQISHHTRGVIQQNVNHALPPYTSAGSLVHMAFWSPAQNQRYTDLYDYPSYGQHFWGPYESFQTQLDICRRQGFIFMPEKQPTALKLGVPVLNPTGVLLASITIQWNQQERRGIATKRKHLQTIALQAARRITQALATGVSP